MLDGGVVIVGAGPAGISAALSLRDLGIGSLVVDSASEVAASWRSRYDRLRLNTGRQFSHLPGRPYPKGTPIYPTRDDVVSHIDSHAREDGILLRLGTTVGRIDRNSRGWRLSTSGGDESARCVVVATGYQNAPVVPAWPGAYTGHLLHSTAYRNPAGYEGRRVLVVGAGSSGLEIAHDLSRGGAATVWLSVRTPPNLLPRKGPAGLPNDVLSIPLYHLPPLVSDMIAVAAGRRTFGDLAEFGLPRPEEGPFARAHRLHTAPAVVDVDVIDAVRDGSVKAVAAVAALHGDSVALADGRQIAPEVMICATGYRPALHSLVGHLGVLTPEGLPVALSPVPAADGLYFHGFLSRPALIGYVARRSRALAAGIARDINSS